MGYNTQQRKILTDFFSQNHDKVFSVEEIAEKLSEKGISLSAVYRNLSALEKGGKVRKTIKNGSRKAFYQYVDCDECKGHLHMSCTKCGQTIHLEEDEADEIVNSILKSTKFSIDTDNTVLYGVCEKCEK